MPAIDMTIEQLNKYMGSSPCPDDMDEYWESALKEADSINYDVKFVESAFKIPNAKCYDIYFTGTKDARIHAKFIMPANIEGKAPALLRFHGLSGHAGEWTTMMWPLAYGYCVAALECRGQGGLSQDVGGVRGTTQTTMFTRGIDGDKQDLLMRDVFLDTYILAKIIMGLPFVDEERIGTFGGSQGAALSLVCASLMPQIKKCAAQCPYLCDYKRVWDMDLDVEAYEGLRIYFRDYDPLHQREKEIFERLGYIDVQNLVKRIKADVLFATGLIDVICPPSTQYAVYNKITSYKRHLIYPDYGHEDMRGYNDTVADFFGDL